MKAWQDALPPDSVLVVTVDGSAEDVERVVAAVPTADIYRVGGKRFCYADPARSRMGVAVNKNTGLELLLDAGVEHFFLSDDDTWPIHPQSLYKHIGLPFGHSMVCWGKRRLSNIHLAGGYATWTWPRGVMLYATRAIVEEVGGMDERFGSGGHEHVEWSNRIYNAGHTPAPYCSPASYGERGVAGLATRASALWHCEDQPRAGETTSQFQRRKRGLTSVRRTEADWDRIEKIMVETIGSRAYVSPRASDNGRGSATLCEKPTSQGDCAVEPAEPRSEK